MDPLKRKRNQQDIDESSSESDATETEENTSISSSSDEIEIDTKEAPVDKETIEKVRPLFEGDVICFHEIFDWLSFVDIQEIAKACKRLKSIVGVYYRNYMASKLFKAKNNNVYAHPCSVNHLSEFIEKVEICSGRAEDGRNFDLNPIWSHCNSIKYIAFDEYICPMDIQNEYFRRILKKVETMELICVLPYSLYGSLLKYCENLKRLSLHNTGSDRKTIRDMDSGNDWLFKHYPTLEHIGIYSDFFGEYSKGTEEFFKRNSHIKSMSVDLLFIQYARKILLECNIKLDDLCLSFRDRSSYKNLWREPDRVEGAQTFELLRQFYDRGIYKRLHIRDADFHDPHEIEQLLDLRGLESIYFEALYDSMPYEKEVQSMCRFEHLMELTLIRSCFIKNLVDLAKNLRNLQRLYLVNANIDDIIPFIQYSAKLIKIAIIVAGHSFGRGDRFGSGFEKVNLIKLNRERDRLFGSQKIIIYIEEDIYLHLKWHDLAELKMIEFRRIDSCKWPQVFAHKILFS